MARWQCGKRPAAGLVSGGFRHEARDAATGREVVLLADDNNDMRDYVRRLLAERYQVEAVRDGQAALEAAWRRPPDLILSDVMMPGWTVSAYCRPCAMTPTP